MIDVASTTFEWPAMLWLLLLVPACVVLYLALLARRRSSALRYASLAAGGPRGASARIRLYLPPLLILLGLAAMILAAARPHAVTLLPARHETVILAMDTSGSMRATDIKPNRLTAAQEAAKAFVAGLPRNVRIGVVAIAAAAAVVQSPTGNREDVVSAIDRFQLQRGSAIGSGLIVSLATLLPEAGIDVEQILHGRSSRLWLDFPPKGESEKAVAPGSNGSVAIVLLSDGESNVGPDPMEAAKLAAKHGVRIHTVGMGTREGAPLGFEGWSMRVRLDEETLKNVATATRGEYFQARNADELKKVYRQISARFALERRRSAEVTAVFVAVGAALAMLGAVLSMFWFSRIL